MIGELIGGRYRVINVLSSGGFGHTYIAADTQRPGNPRCVLKHLTFTSQDPNVLQQVRRLFQAEAETLEQLGTHDQIPRLLAYFEENQQFYLVQEFIEGKPLSDELTQGKKLLESQVIAILEDVLSILTFVHAQGVIHRDIKPANLIRRSQDYKLVLIDFGAVKLIGNTVAETTGETNLSMPVYTSGYAASEQCMGRPRFSSDIYSLGMVAVQALTGLHPSQIPHDYDTSEIIWRNQATVTPELADVLDRMIRYHFNDRYPSAVSALQALRNILSGSSISSTETASKTQLIDTTTLTNETSIAQADASSSFVGKPSSPLRKTLTRVGLAIVGTLALTVLVRNLSDSRWTPLSFPGTTIHPSPLRESERISAGEKSLIKWQISPEKQEGLDRFSSGNYEKAVVAFEAARQKDPSDPELLIYLNNASIGSKKSYTIAVAAPISSGSLSSALELLRGVAQAQQEINQAGGIEGVPLKVFIADDSNQGEAAQNIAKHLVDDSKTLGVVGHGTSDTSLQAAKIYQDGSLVMVSPVSSAVELSNIGDYIFRTIPSDKQTANALKNYMLERLQKRTAVIFHNSNSLYSQSLKEEFKRALGYSGVKGTRVVSEVDLARPDFDPEESINQAIAQKAEVIMLAPNNDVMDRAIRVIESNDRRLPILAGDSMFNSKLPQFAKEAAVGMVLAVPIEIKGTPFSQQATQLWGTANLASWRTALAYDATKALAQAIQQDPSRSGVRRVLSQPSFEAPGANGKVTFQAEGNSDHEPSYVTIAPITFGKTKRFTFISLSARSASPPKPSTASQKPQK